MQSRGVADPDGLLSVIAGPVLEDPLFKILRSIHAVERREVESARSAGDVEQVLDKLLALLKLPSSPKALKT
jgi:hypothetical protein